MPFDSAPLGRSKKEAPSAAVEARAASFEYAKNGPVANGEDIKNLNSTYNKIQQDIAERVEARRSGLKARAGYSEGQKKLAEMLEQAESDEIGELSRKAEEMRKKIIELGGDDPAPPPPTVQ